MRLNFLNVRMFVPGPPPPERGVLDLLHLWPDEPPRPLGGRGSGAPGAGVPDAEHGGHGGQRGVIEVARGVQVSGRCNVTLFRLSQVG